MTKYLVPVAVIWVGLVVFASVAAFADDRATIIQGAVVSVLPGVVILVTMIGVDVLKRSR